MLALCIAAAMIAVFFRESCFEKWESDVLMEGHVRVWWGGTGERRKRERLEGYMAGDAGLAAVLWARKGGEGWRGRELPDVATTECGGPRPPFPEAGKPS